MNYLAIKCALCDLWVHKICEDTTDDLLFKTRKQINFSGLCHALKFDKRMREIERRMQILEEKVPDLEIGLATVKDDIVTLKANTAKLSSESAKKQWKSSRDHCFCP